MLHAPLLGRAVRRPTSSANPEPFTPASYLALRRKAAGVTIEQAAERIACSARRSGRTAQLAELRALLRQLETPGVVARRRETLDAITRAFPFDPVVYRQLATEPADRHPRICLGCGCTELDACVNGALGNCSWAGERICTRCTGGEIH